MVPLELTERVAASLNLKVMSRHRTERIDAHQHFWQYTPEEYGWIDDGMSAIRRDFLPTDLQPLLEGGAIAGTVAVQARQSLDETKWLLELAGRYPAILGIVGWAPIATPEFPAVLDKLKAYLLLKGLRHVIQAEPDDNFILGADFNRGIAALADADLVYDILILERHLPQTIEFVDRHPQQIFVLDHIAKPRIRAGVLEPWAGNMRELAKRGNVYCKLSGMATEADPGSWTPNELAPYFETVLEAFGPERLMMGSDWPVCVVAGGYAKWMEVVEGWIHDLSQDERDRILGGTAIEAYNL